MAEPTDDHQLPDSYYIRIGPGEYMPTWATESPWDTAAQHGGPPSALLGHLIRTVDDVPGFRTARVNVEFLGAVPRAPLHAEARMVRPGRRIRMIEASLSADGRPVAIARGWQIAHDGSTPEPSTTSTIDVTAPQPQNYFPGFDRWGYGESIEWRYIHGSLEELGPAAVWARIRIPLIAGEPVHPLDRTLLVADSANGISGNLPLDEWLFIPPTASVTMHREPTGQWVSIDAETTLSGDGLGTTVATLGDEHGSLGTITQALLVTPR